MNKFKTILLLCLFLLLTACSNTTEVENLSIDTPEQEALSEYDVSPQFSEEFSDFFVQFTKHISDIKEILQNRESYTEETKEMLIVKLDGFSDYLLSLEFHKTTEADYSLCVDIEEIIYYQYKDNQEKKAHLDGTVKNVFAGASQEFGVNIAFSSLSSKMEKYRFPEVNKK